MKKLLTLLVASSFLMACQPQSTDESAPSPKPPEQAISSFDECVAAGYPVMESYPAQCRVPDGPLFVQEIGNELELIEEIKISTPRPGERITSPLMITGSARGNWFFEASMTAELIDENEQPIGQAILQAEGEWMTTEFVPFKGTLEFDTTTAGKMTLLVKNANPSGLPEHEKVLRIPVIVE